MKHFFYVTVLLWLSLFMAVNASAQSDKAKRRDACLRVLRDAMLSAEGFFVRVHAAEFLVQQGQTAQVDSLFTQYQKNPEQFLGATRVLARLYTNDPARRKRYIDQILAVFLHDSVEKQRLVALESLGKLGYGDPLPNIRAQADSGQTAMNAMARWVLANSGTTQTEARLAELLNSSDPLAYRYAAYAFRYRKTVRPATYALLEALARRIAPTDPQRVYVLSAAWVHAPTDRTADSLKTALLTYARGEVAERYELAEALSRRGTAADLPRLTALLRDSNQDVRVAVANAILSIDKRS